MNKTIALAIAKEVTGIALIACASWRIGYNRGKSDQHQKDDFIIKWTNEVNHFIFSRKFRIL